MRVPAIEEVFASREEVENYMTGVINVMAKKGSFLGAAFLYKFAIETLQQNCSRKELTDFLNKTLNEFSLDHDVIRKDNPKLA